MLLGDGLLHRSLRHEELQGIRPGAHSRVAAQRLSVARRMSVARHMSVARRIRGVALRISVARGQ